MKIFGFVLAMIFGINSIAFSQNWFVGAGIDFGISQLSESYEVGGIITEIRTEGLSIRISPEVGYKINRFDFGINPIFQINERTFEQDSNSSSVSTFGIGIGLFLRYNFVTFFDRLSILGRIDLNYLYSEQESFGLSLNNHGLRLSIRPVIQFKVSDRLSLYSSIIGNIASIGYDYSSSNSSGFSRNRHTFIFSLPSVYNFSLTDISFVF